ncbi:MAG: hypothetical protein RSE41_05980, partial [Clostridia bacterium]
YFATETLLKELYGEEVDDLISWWMYENVEKIITQYVTIKGKKQEVTHDVKSLDSLIDYIIKEYSL